MTTGYTREEIRQLKILLDQNIPPKQSLEQIEGAATTSGIEMTTVDRGIFIQLRFEDGSTHDFALNCAVVLELYIGLGGLVMEQDWDWGNYKPTMKRAKSDLQSLDKNDRENALFVLSFRSDSTSDGSLISFRTDQTVLQFYIPKKIEDTLLLTLHWASERWGWWDDEKRLIPSDDEKLQ